MTPSEIADWHEAEAHKYPKDGIAFRGHMKKATTIRAQAEALKIATEALEKQKEGLVCCRDIIDCDDWIDDLTRALARIKEV